MPFFLFSQEQVLIKGSVTTEYKYLFYQGCCLMEGCQCRVCTQALLLETQTLRFSSRSVTQDSLLIQFFYQ